MLTNNMMQVSSINLNEHGDVEEEVPGVDVGQEQDQAIIEL